MGLRIESIVCLIFFLAGGGTCVASFYMPWREGKGFTAPDQYPGLLGPGFQKRTYGIKTIKGVKTRTWEDLTILTCDRAAKVEIAKGLVQEGVCETEVADRLAEECSDKFLTHMDMRCDYYATLWSINIGLEYVTYAMALVGALAGVIMLVPALATSRVVVLPVGLGAYVALLTGAGIQIYMSDYVFKQLGKNAMFPYPGLSGGPYVHILGAHLFVFAALCAMGDFRGTVKEEKPDPLLETEGTPTEEATEDL